LQRAGPRNLELFRAGDSREYNVQAPTLIAIETRSLHAPEHGLKEILTAKIIGATLEIAKRELDAPRFP
jgi:hypothetical protein